jgi:hypothetical protein
MLLLNFVRAMPKNEPLIRGVLRVPLKNADLKCPPNLRLTEAKIP